MSFAERERSATPLTQEAVSSLSVPFAGLFGALRPWYVRAKMDFRILGPLEVWDGERSLQLGGSKRRAVLALLVVNANEVVSTDRIVDMLWGNDAPGNAISALHNHISRLRKELGPELLASHDWGYVLRADPETIDLHRFERLAAEAEALPATERAERLAEALALWRGPALADLTFESALAQDVARLEEGRLVVFERRIDADLEAGRDVELVAELEALIAEHPLREHFRWQLILALYRGGRQAEALEVYRETRRLLSEELGLEPGPQLRDLERAILCQDPALDRPVPADRDALPERTRRARRRAYAAIGGLLALGTISVAAFAFAASGTSPTAKGEHRAASTQEETSKGSATTAARTSPAPAQKSKLHATAKAKRRAAAVIMGPVRGKRPASTTEGRSAPPPPAADEPTRPGTTAPSKPVATPKPSPPPPPPAPPPGPVPPPAPSPPTPPPSAPSPPPPPTLADRTAWWNGSNQPGVTITHTGGQVTFGVAASARDEFTVTIGTRCKAHGDFDAQAGFRLVEWPGANGVWVSLMASNLEGMSTHRTDAYGESYGTYIPGTGGSTVPANGDRGTLRLRRQGNIITGYYRDGDDWVTILRGPGATGDTSLNLSVYNLTYAPFAGRATTVTFDSFALTADALAC
jgi:DNA-binding SARP family transcriptional activator